MTVYISRAIEFCFILTSLCICYSSALMAGPLYIWLQCMVDLLEHRLSSSTVSEYSFLLALVWVHSRVSNLSIWKKEKKSNCNFIEILFFPNLQNRGIWCWSDWKPCAVNFLFRREVLFFKQCPGLCFSSQKNYLNLYNLHVF